MKLSRGISSDGANDVALPNVANAIAPAAISSDGGNPRRDAADVLNPLAGREAEDVEERRQPQEAEHERDRVPTAVGDRGAVGAERHQHVRAGEEQQRREVEQVVDPHAPAAHEPVHRSERAPRPRIDAALLGMPAGQLRDHRGRRDEEDEAREDPQRDRRRAEPRAARDPSQPVTATMFMATTSHSVRDVMRPVTFSVVMRSRA